MKRFISLAICFLMMINIFPVKAFAEEEQSLEEIIRPQVEAFAKSIDQKDADGAAQDALITHGMFGDGKKLSVGKNHAITATLMNSELMQAYLTEACSEMILLSKEIGKSEIHDLGACGWHFNDGSFYWYFIYDHKIAKPDWGEGYYKELKNSDYSVGAWVYYKDILNKNYPDKLNKYDESLKTLVGGNQTDINIKLLKTENEKEIYSVNVTALDKFDFDTDNSSALENLLGFLGMLLFEPFFWESKFDFQIEIPIEKPAENEVFGDFDGSGKVDVSDAYFARLVAAKLVEPTPEQLALCDVDRDGRITAIDANLIRKYAAGIIGKLPVT